MKFQFYSFLPAGVFLLLSGCVWFRDNRPEPDGSPYAAPSRPPKQLYSEAEAVNAAVSAISLRMAASSQGPFRVISAKEATSAGHQVTDALIRMRLSRVTAAHVLLLEDNLTSPDCWNLVLRHPDGTVFIEKTFYLKGKKHAGP